MKTKYLLLLSEIIDKMDIKEGRIYEEKNNI